MKISVKQALAILGITSEAPSKDEIKKAYYDSVKRVHPDVGGDVEEMKRVNAAFEALSDTSFEAKQSRDEFIKRSESIAKGIWLKLEEAYREDLFINYLEELFGSEFTATQEIGARQGITTFHAYFYAKFVSVDQQTILKIRGFADTLNIMTTSSETLQGSAEFDIPLSIDMEIVHGNKKIKPYRRDYIVSKSSRFLFSPEDLFPRAKMEKAIEAAGRRKFSKQDMLGALRNRLNASIDGETIFIPIRDRYKLVLYRLVFNRVAGWGCNGFYSTKPHMKLLQGIMSMAESEATLEMIESCVRALEQASDEEMLEVARRELNRLHEESKRNP